ncbi:MAG: helix-turn-helix transcriptional regulator [Tannerella sp.]|jgi:DNA-binding HxlR family transcriptional regulator|nr:helix-turn-helix transcriptional regulator [Tannerella sp.]
MEKFLHEGICPIRDILSRLGDKWSLLVLVTLSANGTMRFSDIQKSIGDISQRMLTVTLRSLEADGLAVRKIYPEVPPRVEYSLTQKGHSLLPHLDSLVTWAVENMQEIVASRQSFDDKSQ